ncbi:hypothetical protein KY332_04930 [Candidatus Woesearchaeota archaeon]|nr:hypothetical protein [Candidatus Woesearchaeota archaeon]
MTDENEKFVEEMLKSAEKKKETKPQKRTEGVDKEEVEDMTAEILGWKKKKEK